MLRAFLSIGLLQFLTMLLLLVRTKSLAVLLGPDSLGVLAVIDRLVMVIAQTASLSLPFAAIRFLPAPWRSDPAEFRALFLSMRRVLLTLVAVAMAATALLTVLIPGIWGAELEPHRPAVVAALFGLPALALIPFAQNAWAGRLDERRAMVVGVGNAAILACAAILGVRWSGLTGYYGFYAAAGLALALGMTWWAGRIERAPAATLRPSASGARGAPEGQAATLALEASRLGPGGLPRYMWRFCLTMLGLAFMAPFAVLAVQYRVLSDLGATASGLMQAAVGTALSIKVLLGSAHAVYLTPHVNKGGSPAERMAWASEFQVVLCTLIVLGVPVLLLVPDWAIRLLYSSEFTGAAPFVVLFICAEALILLSATYQALIVALDHLPFHVVQNVVAQTVLFIVGVSLIPSLGIAGAGMAMISAPLVLFVSTIVFLHARHGVRPSPRATGLTAYALLAVASAGVLGLAFPETTPIVLALKVAAYLVLTGGVFLALPPHQRAQLRLKVTSILK